MPEVSPLTTCEDRLNRASMVRQAHHDNCHPEHVEGWIHRASVRLSSRRRPENDKNVSLLIAILVILFTILVFLFPATVLSDVIVHDMISVKGEKVMLTAETRGKLFAKGGEVAEFFVDKKSIGKG